MGKTVLDITGGSLRAKVNEKLSSIASTVKHKNAISNGIVEENTYYDLGTITSAPTITAVENSYDESVIIFTVGGSDSIPAFPFIPSGYKLVDIPIKEFSVGSKYVICYWNSTVIIKRLTSSTKASGETWNGYTYDNFDNRSEVSASAPGSEFESNFIGGDTVASNKRSTRFIYTYDSEGPDRIVATDYVQDGAMTYGPYSRLEIQSSWYEETDGRITRKFGEITDGSGDIYLNAYMIGNRRIHYGEGSDIFPANNYTNKGTLSSINFSNGLTSNEQTWLNNTDVKRYYDISAIRFGSIVTDFSIQSKRDARYIKDFEVDNGNTVLSFDGVSLNKTVNNKKTSLFIIPSKVTVIPRKETFNRYTYDENLVDFYEENILDLSSLNVDYFDKYALVGFGEHDISSGEFDINLKEIILPSSIKGFTSPASSHSGNVFSLFDRSFSTNVAELAEDFRALDEVTLRYPGTMAQAIAAIDELHDSTAYSNSIVPLNLVCSDGTIDTQSLFNS